jgi:hypothetical protein
MPAFSLRHCLRFIARLGKTAALVGTVYLVFTTPVSLSFPGAEAQISTLYPARTSGTPCNDAVCARWDISAPPLDTGLGAHDGTLDNMPADSDVPEMPAILVPFFLMIAGGMMWFARQKMKPAKYDA